MAKSVKVNYVLNLINTVVGLLFPIVTFPYISRVLMADGIGKVQFLNSIVGYVMLLCALGIPLYAVREIARIRDDVKERNRTTVEILILHSLLTILGYFVILILGFSVGKIRQDIWLFFLLSLQLVLNSIGANWFYQAIEDFGYITVRSLIVRLLTLVALFTLVKTKDDLYIYAGITILAEAGNYLFNFIHLNKYIKKKEVSLKNLNIWRHLSPALHIFLLNLITSIYVNLDSVMLGFLSSEEAVGYYAASTRITKATLSIITSLGVVLMPRLSNQAMTGKVEEFKRTSQTAYNFIITLALPMVVGLIITSPEVITIFCGEHFGPSVLTMQIISPIILLIGVSNLVGLRIFYSLGKENFVILSTLVGALLNLTLNFLLIPHYDQYGAAVATVIAELSVTCTMIFIGRKFIPFNVINKNTILVFVFSMVIIIPLLILKMLQISVYHLVVVEIIASAIVYILLLWISHNESFIIITNSIKRYVKLHEKKI